VPLLTLPSSAHVFAGKTLLDKPAVAPIYLPRLPISDFSAGSVGVAAKRLAPLNDLNLALSN
jgi:hypothetical protein